MERPDAHHHHTLHTSGRLRHLIRPHGKHFHIVQSPTEAENLRESFSAPLEQHSNEPREVLLHGSEEHIQTLREIHAHLEAERATLRKNHGGCDELEIAVLELHALSSELRSIERATSDLDAAVFGKYGYSKTIRTHTDGNSAAQNGDATATPNTVADWHARRHQGDTMRFFSKPILRQYFHNGLLWRAANTQEVASYELFLDLIYVGIIAICGDNASETADGRSLLRFIITFIMTWKIWQEICMQINWFDANDAFRRYYVLLNLACLLGIATNIETFWEDGYTPLVAFYLAARFTQALYYCWVSYWLPFVRVPTFLLAILIVIPAALRIGSIHVEQYRSQALIWSAIVIDLSAPGITAGIMFNRAGLFERWHKKHFAFFPALNIEHRIERTHSFVILVLGYSVVATIYQSHSLMGVNAFFGKAVLGLSQAYAFGAIYFEMDSFNLHQHAIRRSSISAMTWNMFHLSFILGFVLAGAALARMVLATDSANSPLEALSESSKEKADEHVSDGVRWFYCAGLSVAMFSVTMISISNRYRATRGCSLFPKSTRYVLRITVSLVFLLLGLAHSLNSLELIGLTTSLSVMCVMVEVIGNVARDPEKAWWKQGRGLLKRSFERQCTYFAKEQHIERATNDSDKSDEKVMHRHEVGEVLN